MHFKVGDIAHTVVHGLSHSKGKYAVCVCESRQLFFLINTENRHHYDCIPILKKPTRNFPIHDSFIACRHAYEFPIESLSFVSKIDSQELKLLLVKVKESKTLPFGQKRDIIQSIENFRK